MTSRLPNPNAVDVPSETSDAPQFAPHAARASRNLTPVSRPILGDRAASYVPRLLASRVGKRCIDHIGIEDDLRIRRRWSGYRGLACVFLVSWFTAFGNMRIVDR